jgi:hypothetical protein
VGALRDEVADLKDQLAVCKASTVDKTDLFLDIAEIEATLDQMKQRLTTSPLRE